MSPVSAPAPGFSHISPGWRRLVGYFLPVACATTEITWATTPRTIAISRRYMSASFWLDTQTLSDGLCLGASPGVFTHLPRTAPPELVQLSSSRASAMAPITCAAIPRATTTTRISIRASSDSLANGVHVPCFGAVHGLFTLLSSLPGQMAPVPCHRIVNN